MMQLPPTPKKYFRKIETILNRLENGRINELGALDEIYNVMNRFNQWIAQFMSCKVKCSHCCSIPVDLTDLEARYISDKIGIAINDPVEVLDHCVTFTPCPFLSHNDECKIYQYRPFNCRTFHSAGNPDDCKYPDKTTLIFGSASHEYSSDFLLQTAMIIHALNSGRGSNDIRQYFGTSDNLK